MRRLLATLLALVAALALLGAVVVTYAVVYRRFGLVWALAAVGLVLSVFLPAGEAVRRARFWRWLAGER